MIFEEKEIVKSDNEPYTLFTPYKNRWMQKFKAGTGCDAAQYFRVFNPITQQLKFDPDKEYVRKWV